MKKLILLLGVILGSLLMQSCCCEIKTQMLQDRLDAAERSNLAKDNQLSNYDQTQTILGQLGRWVANPPVA